MTIEQTIEVPADRRVFFEFLAPKDIPTGLARIELKLTPVREREDDENTLTPISDTLSGMLSDKPTPRADRLLGIATNLGDITIEEIRDERLAKYI